MSDLAKKIAHAHVSATGEVNLPADFRQALGIEGGGEVVVELNQREIRIRNPNDAVARVQALAKQLFADNPKVSVDDFLAHRREDWSEE